MNIDDWIKVHEANFGSSYEKKFALNILAKVNALDLNTVSTQYPFKDLDGKNRYCDFTIQEGAIKIAIEIDGYDKRNTGQGMSHDDFVDWQRRQAALTSFGWYVLRFANRDVINEPKRCQRYIELLLRDQRSKSQHQADLEAAINRLNYQLLTTQNRVGTSEQVSKLQREINLLKNQLQLAQNSQPLTEDDKSELENLVNKLEQEKKELISERNKIREEKAILATSNSILGKQKSILDGENNTMKTTIWAFAVIIAVMIASGTYVFTKSPNIPLVTPPSAHENTPLSAPQDNLATQTTPSVENKQLESRTLTSSSTPTCDASIDWAQAKDHVNQRIAVHGVVADYRYNQKGKGSPTWINLGAKYPDKERLSVVVWGEHRDNFGHALSDRLVNRQICVIGTVKLYNDIAQITLNWPKELVFQ